MNIIPVLSAVYSGACKTRVSARDHRSVKQRKHSVSSRDILYKSTQAKAETVKGSSQRSHTLTGGKSLAPALQNSYLDSYTRFSVHISMNISQIYSILRFYVLLNNVFLV